MAWTTEVIKGRLGLESEGPRTPGAPVLLTGAAADPKSELVAALSSSATFDENDNPRDISLSYLRHLPYESSLKRELVHITMQDVPGKPGEVEPAQIRVQSSVVFDRARGDDPHDPVMQKKINRVIGAVGRMNEMLRNYDPVENAAKILLKDLHLQEVTGEKIEMAGLDGEGGFKQLYMPGIFLKASSRPGNDNTPPFAFRATDVNDLKTFLGFRINTLDPGRDYSGDRKTHTNDPDTDVAFMSGVRVKEKAGRFEMEMYIEPEDIPEGADPKAIPNLVKLSFVKKDKDTFVLDDAQFMGQKVSPSDTQTVLKLIGLAQAANEDFARRKYPAYTDGAYEFDLSGMIDPLNPPPALKDGGEMNIVSLHGSGTEKRIEHFGDQIGIAAQFLHRGTREDGSISTVGVIVDFPFAAGGPSSAFDGVTADFLPFWKHTEHIFITHGHFDHNGGVRYWVEKGLMKGKTIHAEEREIYMLQKELGGIPRNLWPKFDELKGDGAVPVSDAEGNTRFWVQYATNATEHSALCTPYLVTGCMNDDHYNGSVLVYGDSRGLRDEKKSFFEQGTRTLPAQAAAHKKTVTPEKVDKDITVVMHDVTAVREEGRSADFEEIRKNLIDLIGLFSGKLVLLDPISTNHPEYMAGIDAAATGAQQRHVVGVGGKSEMRLACLNLHGVDPYFPLADKRIDIDDPLVPEIVRDSFEEYMVLKKIYETADEGEDRSEARGALKDFIYGQLASMGAGAPNPAFRSTAGYMFQSLVNNNPPREEYDDFDETDGETENRFVTFKDDINGRLMWKCIEMEREWAPIRRTRGSDAGKSLREDPGSLLIFTTGTQGNSDERLSTVQKVVDMISLLDADMSVRPTGYKVNVEDAVFIITQSAIVGNEDPQRQMVDDLVRARNTTVVCAYKDGFTIFNPKGMQNDLLEGLKALGCNPKPDGTGNIDVSMKPIHYNGHGRQLDVLNIVKVIAEEKSGDGPKWKSTLHAMHHIPDAASIVQFNKLMDENEIPRAKEKPDDFKVMRIDAHKPEAQDKFKCVAQLNPSYIGVTHKRKLGRVYGGWLEWTRMQMSKRSGKHRQDGMDAGSKSDGVFKKSTARAAWDHISNPDSWNEDPTRQRRARKLDPSDSDRRPPHTPRSRAMLRGFMPGRRA